MMLFLPVILPVQQASAIVQAGSMFVGLSMVYKYRKHVNGRLCLKPWLFYFPIFYASLSVAVKIDTSFLKPVLGLFLVVLSVYCVCFSEKIHIRASTGSALVCGGISGIADAFFSIGGPPIVLYFLATTEEKEEYLGSIQLFFMISNVIGTCMRISKGLITRELLPYMAVGIVMLLAGRSIGSQFVERMDQARMKKLIYGFVGVAGMITFVTNLSALGI